MSARLDLVGQSFGRLTVLAFAQIEREATRWLCECRCGARLVVAGRNLRSGNTASCGCLHREIAADCGRRSRIHGEGAGTPEYKSWAAMKARCLNPADKDFPSYGGRGVQICARWRNDYAAFLADMGRRPSIQHTLDRFPNNDGDYEPSNCRWATKSEQALNRSPKGTRRAA